MSYGFLKIKEIRFTGSDFESEDFYLRPTVNGTSVTETITLKRNYYTKLNYPLKELSYSGSSTVNVSLDIEHIELEAISPSNSFSLVFDSELEHQLIEKNLVITHPTEPTEKIYLDVIYEFYPYPAFYSEYTAMLDCLKQLEEFYFTYSDDGGTLDTLFDTVKNSKLPDLFSAYGNVATALSISGLPVYNSSEPLVYNVYNLELINQSVNVNWNEITIGSTLITNLQSEFNTFKTAFLALKAALEALGIFLCEKYFQWRGPSELFEDYSELHHCLCLYEAQYSTLSPAAKTLVDEIRDQLNDLLEDMQEFAKSKGFSGLLPTPFASNMCSLFEQTRSILGFLKTKYYVPEIKNNIPT